VILLDFVLEQGEFELELHERLAGRVTALFGPSGSGKTTTLDAIAGLRTPAAGEIRVGDRTLFARGRAIDLASHERHVGYVTQDVALFPHMHVRRNVLYGRRRGQKLELDVVARMLEIAPLLDRPVARLSGGERQRVALARALAPDPALLLLDEPLGSLDRPLRERLLADLAALFERLGRAVLVVTHDVGEAFALADRVAVVREGRIVQAAAPDHLWARPADAWTARFLGLGNVRERDGQVIVIRPEAVQVAPGDGATVLAADRRGPVVRLRIRRDDGEELEAVTTELGHPRPGDRVAVEIDPAGVVTLPE
jgi:thiamine transport system ATP-binding protein